MVRKLFAASFLLTFCLPLVAQEDSVWKLGRKKVTFFKAPKKPAPKVDRQNEVEELFAETSMDEDGKTTRKLPPRHLVDLLVNPGKKTAASFVSAEKQKVELLLKAMEEISKISEDKK